MNKLVKLYKINNLTIGKENWELRAKGLVYTCYKIIPVTCLLYTSDAADDPSKV